MLGIIYPPRRSQDAVVNDFQAQLKVKDEEYVKALKQQAEDVEELLERMRNEFKELQVIGVPEYFLSIGLGWRRPPDAAP